MRLIIAFGVLVLIVVAYYGTVTYRKTAVSKMLVDKAKPFEVDRRANITSTTSVLVLGDSTGVGVGADRPEDSVAGLLSEKINAATLENYSVSGAVVDDLPAQVAKAKLKQYSFILIQIGGNDIIRFHSAKKTAAALDAVLATLPKSHRVAVMSAGNVGATTLFPWFMHPFYTALNLKYHEEFGKVVKARKFTYVNLYKEPAADLFSLRPDVYLSADGLHPSSKGYDLWLMDLMNSL